MILDVFQMQHFVVMVAISYDHCQHGQVWQPLRTAHEAVQHVLHASVLQEQFLLAGNSSSNTQVALPELPYTMEQLQQMQAAAAAIVASKADIQQCTVVLNEFPLAKYTQYIELKGQEMQLKEKDFDIDSRRFGLKQKEDEHSLRKDRERAELEDHSAKRRRFNASTDDGITFKSAGKGCRGCQ